MGIEVLNPAFNSPQAGMVTLWAGPLGSIPAGWIVCDGSLISRTTYKTLFSVLGTYWSSGDGLTTFGIPNYQDRALVGGDVFWSTSGPSTTFQNQAVGAQYGGQEGTYGTATGTVNGPSTTLPSGTTIASGAELDNMGTLADPTVAIDISDLKATPTFAAILVIIKT